MVPARPSRTPLRWLAVVAALALAGCGGTTSHHHSATGGSGHFTLGGTGTTTTTTAPPGSPLDKKLDAQLLTVADLPSGWVADGVSSKGGGSSICGLGTSLRKKEAGRASAAFAHGELPVLDEVLASYAFTPSSLYGEAVHRLAACGAFASGAYRFTISRLAYPTLPGADQRAAFAATSRIKGFVVGETLVVAVKGHEILTLIYGGEGVPKASQTEAFARTAVARAGS